MRPAGAVRAALRAHLDKLDAGTPGVTWRDLAQALADAGLINMAAPSELRLVQKTIENMCMAGELPAVGEGRRPWSQRPLKLYGARAAVRPGGVDAARELGAAMFAMASVT